MVTYLLVAIDRHDLETYARYEQAGLASVAKFGVQPLAVSDNLEVLEGVAPSKRFVLLRFNSKEALHEWYDSPEYQKALPLRQQSAETLFAVAFEGIS